MATYRRIVCLLLSIAVVLCSACTAGTSPEATFRAAAKEMAASLARREFPQPTLGDPEAERAEFEAVIEGMGAIPLKVDVVGISMAQDLQSGVARLNVEWQVHADKEPWSYESTMRLKRVGETGWGLEWQPSIVEPSLAKDGLRAVRLAPKRGRILGQGGVALVADRLVSRVGIDRARVGDPETTHAAAVALAELVGIDPVEYGARVAAAGPQAFVEAIVLRSESPELAKASAGAEKIPGATLVGDLLPLGPTPGFARPIFGTVGPATAEIIERSGGLLSSGDMVGLSGLQASADEELRGSAGYVIEAVNLDTRGTRRIFAVPARTGLDVVTHLDVQLQQEAEAVLANVADKPSALVAIRPSDGHVLAAASGPGSQGYSTATLGQYAPGSTFKTVSMLALMRKGLDENAPTQCPSTLVAAGRSFKNDDNYSPKGVGTVTFRTAFANSCNTALIDARGMLGAGDLAATATSLGLTRAPALGVPAALGTVPETESDVDLAVSMIGQGRIVTTPLGMATLAASIAAGHPVAPTLVDDSSLPKPTPVEVPASAEEAARLQALLRAVVTEGSATFLADVPGAEVMAKTGTAEYGNDTPPRTHAWMIGIQGDLAVAVLIDDGGSGAGRAGPLLKDFIVRVNP